MTFFNVIQQLLSSGSPWIYAAIFVMAVLEGFVGTTFLINGTIGFVAVGGFLAHGYLNPAATIGCIYIGTMAGDGLTFILSTRLQRIALIARYQQKFEKYRAPLARNPFRFIVLGHLTPYLKGISALLAGGVVSWRTWVRAEAVGAFCGTLLFTGLGAAGVLLFAKASHLDAVSVSAGVIVLLVFIAVWVRALRPCRISGVCAMPANDRSKGRNWKRIFFVLYFLFWRPIRMIEAALRKLPTRSFHPDLAAAFPDVMPGDIFLVRLHMPAPWGKWAHTAIAIDHENFCHGFGKTITAHRFDSLPVRYTVAHMRVKCDADTAARAGAIAAEMIGKPVSIFARPDDTAKFSCTSLVVFAFASAGVTLAPEIVGRVVPDDLFHSPKLEVIRIVFTEGRSELKGAHNAEQQDAGCRALPVRR